MYGSEWGLRTDTQGQTFMVKPRDFGYFLSGIVDCGISSWNQTHQAKQIATRIPSSIYNPYIYGIQINW